MINSVNDALAKRFLENLVSDFTNTGFQGVADFYERMKDAEWFETFSFEIDHIHTECNHVAFLIHSENQLYTIICSNDLLEIKNKKGVISRSVKTVVTHYYDENTSGDSDLIESTIIPSDKVVSVEESLTSKFDLLVKSYNKENNVYQCFCLENDNSIEEFALSENDILEFCTRYQMRIKGWIF